MDQRDISVRMRTLPLASLGLIYSTTRTECNRS
jgi:hypothetical protein